VPRIPYHPARPWVAPVVLPLRPKTLPIARRSTCIAAFGVWLVQAVPHPGLESAAAAQQQQQQHVQPKEPYRLKYAAGPEGRLCHVSDAEAAPDLSAEKGPLYFVAGGGLPPGFGHVP
jgi:hypothetical protein